VRLDIFRGVPAIYANYIGYDEVAHHLGPRSRPAFRVLKALDRQIRDVYRAVESVAPRQYDLYIMSDHGMTESLPFHHLFGETLGQFMARHGVASAQEIATRGYQDRATLQQVEELSAEIGPRTNTLTSFFVDRAMRLAMRIGTGPLQAGLSDSADSPLLAIYSSALANVYFHQLPHRPKIDEVQELAPGLLQALTNHTGIGLVLVRGDAGVIALHNGLETVLDDAAAEDIAFLSLYDDPELVRDQLIALANMPSAGDLLVFGAYDGKSVVNFEDHAGAHGGLGGVQMFPFIVAPRAVEVPFQHVNDAPQLHAIFAERYQGRPATGLPPRAVAS